MKTSVKHKKKQETVALCLSKRYQLFYLQLTEVTSYQGYTNTTVSLISLPYQRSKL